MIELDFIAHVNNRHMTIYTLYIFTCIDGSVDVYTMIDISTCIHIDIYIHIPPSLPGQDIVSTVRAAKCQCSQCGLTRSFNEIHVQSLYRVLFDTRYGCHCAAYTMYIDICQAKLLFIQYYAS